MDARPISDGSPFSPPSSRPRCRRAAESVGRIREVLEPSSFVPRLDDDFQHLDEPRSLRDLADLADHVGLSRLAVAWRAEAQAPDEPAR